jgi:hypothetical protein
MTVGRRLSGGWPARLAVPLAGIVAAVALAWLPARAASADEGAATTPDQARVALIGPDVTLARIRAVVDELLSRERVAAAWSNPARFSAADVLEARTSGEPAAIAVWIDCSSAAEALLAFRDPAGQRFVVRRVSTAGTSDEIAAEEIGQIVKSVVLALRAGTVRTLSQAETRAALGERAPRDAPPPAVASARAPAPARSSPLAPELGAAAIVQRFAPQISWSERVEIGAAVFRERAPERPGWARGFGAGVTVGYAPPIHYRDPAVALDLSAIAIRAGVLWEPRRAERTWVRLGCWGGVDWVTFQPRAVSPDVTAAPADRFATPVASLTAAIGVMAARHVSIALGAVLDVTGTEVHYDVRDASGASTRVIVPFVARPGASAGVAWRF